MSTLFELPTFSRESGTAGYMRSFENRPISLGSSLPLVYFPISSNVSVAVDRLESCALFCLSLKKNLRFLYGGA